MTQFRLKHITLCINLFAMDQGALLECFHLHSISHKDISEQQTQKISIIRKYRFCKRHSIKLVIQFSLYNNFTVFT